MNEFKDGYTVEVVEGVSAAFNNQRGIVMGKLPSGNYAIQFPSFGRTYSFKPEELLFVAEEMGN